MYIVDEMEDAVVISKKSGGRAVHTIRHESYLHSFFAEFWGIPKHHEYHCVIEVKCYVRQYCLTAGKPGFVYSVTKEIKDDTPVLFTCISAGFEYGTVFGTRKQVDNWVSHMIQEDPRHFDQKGSIKAARYAMRSDEIEPEVDSVIVLTTWNKRLTAEEVLWKRCKACEGEILSYPKEFARPPK